MTMNTTKTILLCVAIAAVAGATVAAISGKKEKEPSRLSGPAVRAAVQAVLSEGATESKALRCWAAVLDESADEILSAEILEKDSRNPNAGLPTAFYDAIGRFAWLKTDNGELEKKAEKTIRDGLKGAESGDGVIPPAKIREFIFPDTEDLVEGEWDGPFTSFTRYLAVEQTTIDSAKLKIFVSFDVPSQGTNDIAQATFFRIADLIRAAHVPSWSVKIEDPDSPIAPDTP